LYIPRSGKTKTHQSPWYKSHVENTYNIKSIYTTTTSNTITYTTHTHTYNQ
jgi:hypothetical protein